MKESGYQSKLIKDITRLGGVAINGVYSTSGESDLQCGIPYEICGKRVLLHIAIEVKDEENYYRVMKAVDKDYNVIDEKKLKPHEFVQMAKIRRNRRLGGLALVAFSIAQVERYLYEVHNAT